MATNSDDLATRHVRTLEMFVLRARRIEAHSLAADQHMLYKLAHNQMRIEGVPAEGKIYLVHELPPEEQLESAAARVRPLVLKSEDTYYARVLEALGYFVRESEELAKAHREIRDSWRKVVDGKKHLGAYSQIQDAEGNESEMLSDLRLAFAYIYGDVVHHDTERIASTKMFGIKNRYRSAAPVVAHIMFLTLATLNLVRRARGAGLILLVDEVFSEEVVVTETAFRNEIRVWTAPVGSPPPQGMSKKFGEGWEEIVTARPAGSLA